MPKNSGYSTGGVKAPPSTKEGGTAVDVGLMGAGMGSAYSSPNNKDYHPLPGGKGSSGSKSTSKPK